MLCDVSNKHACQTSGIKPFASFDVLPYSDQGSAVTLVVEAPHACMQMAGELQHMQAALDRATLDEYHKLDPLGHGPELKSLQDHRAQRQQDFSNQFLSLLHQHETAMHTGFLQVKAALGVTVSGQCQGLAMGRRVEDQANHSPH